VRLDIELARVEDHLQQVKRAIQPVVESQRSILILWIALPPLVSSRSMP